MQLWDRFLTEQEDEMGAECVRKWLRTLRVLRFDAGNLHLEAKDPFQSVWFEEHIRSKAEAYLHSLSKKNIKIHLCTLGVACATSHRNERKKIQEKEEPPAYTIASNDLNPLCTFEHFYAADSNLLAHKILLEVTGYHPQQNVKSHSASQLAVFNPIYIYGRMGTGKTHLLMATAYALRQTGVNAIYAHAETFTENVVTAIRAGEMALFRRTYRDADVLLLDDLQVFSRKTSTQEEFFHTFNSLHLAGRQIVLSASCAPQELQLIEPRLVSRFEWGIVMPLELLKQSDLVNVLKLKASALKIPLTPTLTQFLCETFGSSAKALCRALETLLIRKHLQNPHAEAGQPIDVAHARMLLSDLIQEEERQSLQPEQILQKVAENYGIRIDDLTARDQTRDAVLPRQLAMYICRQSLKMPFMKIGELFGRDHSTVMSSVKQVEKLMKGRTGNLAAVHDAILKRLQP